MATEMQVEILEDGTISVTTGDIEDTKHVSADNLLDELEQMSGGRRERQRRENPFWKKRAVLKGGRIVKTKQ